MTILPWLAGGAALGLAARRGHRGVYDPGILKAAFLAGGPGSGKSYVARSVFGLTSTSFAPSGLKLVNSDPFFELLLKREGIDPADLADLPSMTYRYATEAPTGPRMRAKALSEARASAWIDQRLGLVVEGTGRRFEKIQGMRERLQDLGYDTAMVYVNTSLPVALARNARRSRRLPEREVTRLWNESQENMGRFQTLFGRRRFYLVDNSRPVPVDATIVRAVERFVQAPLRNPIGKRWISAELRKRRR